jgi:hypothetical protein
MKNAVFWDVTYCGSCKNRYFGGSYRLHPQGENNQRNVILRSVVQLLATANVVPSSLFLSTLMLEAIRSSEASILTTARWRNISDGGILLHI